MFDRIVRRSLLLSFALMALLTGCGVSSTPHSQTRAQAVPCTLAAGSARSYAEIRTGLINTLTHDQTDADSAILTYAAPLKGQSVAWQGWIVAILPDQKMGTTSVAIDMDEFAGIDKEPAAGSEYEGVRRIGLVDVVLTQLPLTTTRELNPGQKVVFTGAVQDLRPFELKEPVADFMTADIAVMVEPTSLTPVTPQMLSDCTSPEQTQITLTRPHCTMMSKNCYTANLVIDTSGTVVYTARDWNDQVPGTTKEARISPEQFEELLRAFEEAQYFTLKDDYSSFDVSDSPSATTSITMGTARKSVYHYYGDRSAPDSLSTLEDRIDAIVNTAQFER